MFKPLKKQRSYEGLPRPGDLAREFLVKGFGEMKRFRPSELIQEDSGGGGGGRKQAPLPPLLSLPPPPVPIFSLAGGFLHHGEESLFTDHTIAVRRKPDCSGFKL